MIRVTRIPERERWADEEWRVLIQRGSTTSRQGGLEIDLSTEMLDQLVEQYEALRRPA
jgi:hypothetical protein